MISIKDISIITVTFNSEKIIKFLLQSELKKLMIKKLLLSIIIVRTKQSA